MTSTDQSLVLAAGVVCWRVVDGKVRVLLIRQSGRSDMSIPKGKVDPGESLPEAAVRETLEETSLTVSLGAPLGVSEYTLPAGRDKVVHYWAAEVTDAALAASRFKPNGEISALEWMSVRAARAKLIFDGDREVIDRFAQRVENNALRTFAIIALRHGKAVAPDSWSGPDSSRPLEELGAEQARSVAKTIAAFAPAKLISSTAARCMATVEPLATLTGLNVTGTAAISQDAHEDGDADVAGVIAKRIAKRQTAVLCSHGPVLPDILDQIKVQAGSTSSARIRRASMLDVGEFTAVHLSVSDPTGGIVAIEMHSPILL